MGYCSENRQGEAASHRKQEKWHLFEKGPNLGYSNPFNRVLGVNLRVNNPPLPKMMYS